MSMPTERDVEARVVHRQRCSEDENGDGCDCGARQVIERIKAQARREGAAEALKRAANRIVVATTPHSPTFDAYMEAARIVRETAFRGNA